MTIKSEEVKKVILEEDDFGHELRVGAVFQNAQQDIDSCNPIWRPPGQHGGTYTDPIQKTLRQFDFRFEVRRGDDQSGQLKSYKSLLLAVECKNLHPSSPIVICGVPRSDHEATHTYIESETNEYRQLLYRAKITMRRFRSQIYPSGDFVGKSIVRLEIDKKGNWTSVPQADVYEKWSQAVQSATELAESAPYIASDMERKKVSTLILPIVVVPDGVLWKAEYRSGGTISQEPSQTDACEFWIGKTLEVGTAPSRWNFVISHFHFFTLKGFENFLAKFLRKNLGWSDWNNAFPLYAEDAG